MKLCGRDFQVHWARDDHRLIANRETWECYELVSFNSMKEHDSGLLRVELPSHIERCWFINPGYERDGVRELLQWQEETGYCGYDLPTEALTPEGDYLPPISRGLQVVTIKNCGPARQFPLSRHEEYLNPLYPDQTFVNGIVRSMGLLRILEEVFFEGNQAPPPNSFTRFTPGIQAFIGIFPSESVCYLKDVTRRDVPDEAKSQWKLDNLLTTVGDEIKSQRAVEMELHRTRTTLEKVTQAAAATLSEALEAWMRFEPPNMGVFTKAKIEKAVKLYCTDPEKRSLRRIADEFRVSRTAISKWFKIFTEHTGFPVVIHKRHESLTSHLARDAEQKRPARPKNAAGSAC